MKKEASDIYNKHKRVYYPTFLDVLDDTRNIHTTPVI